MTIEIAYEYHTTVLVNEETQDMFHCKGDFDPSAAVVRWSTPGGGWADETDFSIICETMETDPDDLDDWQDAGKVIFAWANLREVLIQQASTL